MGDSLSNKTNLRNFEPPTPGAIDYDQALKSIGSMPAISPGQNDVTEYTTNAQPKEGLGGEAAFK